MKISARTAGTRDRNLFFIGVLYNERRTKQKEYFVKSDILCYDFF